MDSLETAQARTAADLTEERWRDHRSGCPACVTAQRARKPHNMCDTGFDRYWAHKAAAAELARQRERDKQPIPGQQVLF